MFDVSDALAGLGVDELRRRQEEVTRLLDQDGVVYRTSGAGRERWRLDPVPVVVGSREWTEIEGGLIERAELLDMVLADLYGPRELLRRRLIPPEVVLGHPGFLHACDGIRLPGVHQLFSYAADLGRGDDGRLVVLADRAQAPSGSGYAMENRLVCSRVLPTLYRDAGVHRLAPFFRWLRSALQAAAPPGVEDPRIVVLSPGPYNETAFEHAVLASTLGYPLVEGSDLTVRGGSVWMRSLGRHEPVHVILRRVDDTYCDPLELHPDSQLGVTGLVQATRAGTVTVVNALGSGVLENPALAAFEDRVARHLLGRPLRLPAVRTWWCGDPESRAYVLAHLEELVLRPVAPIRGNGSVFGWEGSAEQLEQVRRRIEARPADWVGQEAATAESAPTLTGTGIELRRSVLRAFAIPRGDSYAVMPGGLTRVAGDSGRGRISAQDGAVSKDTWVLASEPERPTGFWLQTGPATPGVEPGAPIPSRVAENLWWLGRYAERAEAVTRLLRVVHDRRNEFAAGTSEPGAQALEVLLQTAQEVEASPASLVEAVGRIVAAADAVRDQLSRDTWLVLGSLRRTDDLGEVLRSLLALSGLGEQSMGGSGVGERVEVGGQPREAVADRARVVLVEDARGRAPARGPARAPAGHDRPAAVRDPGPRRRGRGRRAPGPRRVPGRARRGPARDRRHGRAGARLPPPPAAQAAHVVTTYRVTHSTQYEYEGEVAASHSLLRLLPRDGEGQTCVSTEIASAPLAGDYAEHTDFFGNRVGYLAVHEPHRALHITATSVVEVEEREPTLFADVPWERARDAGTVDAVPFALDSPLVAASPALRAYAEPSFPAGRGLLDAVTELASRIHADFAYAPGSTEVATPLEEVLEGRTGVCQDFAHVGIGCLRSLGLPARYVSGYLETDPPPGRPKLVGADVSHAWFSVLVPEAGWLDLDPTNDQLVNHRYVVTAFGRDYRDVPPVSGVVYTEGGTATLRVSVDVAVV